MLKEFRAFMLRGNIVELAVAIVIGAAFGALVTSLVANLLTPIVAAIIGKPDFSDLTFTINDSVFRYGSFLNALIAFVSIAAAVFFFVVRPIDAIQRRMGIEKPEDGRSDEAVLLEEIRDLLKDAARMTTIETTAGPVDAGALGRTLCHEHLLTVERADPLPVPPPRTTTSVSFSARSQQVRAAMGHGVRTIVDPGVHGPRARRAAGACASPRRPASSSSWRPASTGSTTRSSRSTSRRATRTTWRTSFVHDIEVGIQGTPVKAAFIKTAADEPGITPDVEKVHRAAARASNRTGRPIMAHSRPGEPDRPRPDADLPRGGRPRAEGDDRPHRRHRRPRPHRGAARARAVHRDGPLRDRDLPAGRGPQHDASRRSASAATRTAWCSARTPARRSTGSPRR